MTAVTKRDETTISELAAARSDMTSAIDRHIKWLVDNWKVDGATMSVAEASERARTRLNYPIDDPAEVTWHTLGNLIEHEPERGAALWEDIRDAARQELESGIRAARTVERSFADPYERAQFSVVLEALVESLTPQSGAEHLLVQQMAVAFEQTLRWQARITSRVEQEAWTGDRDRRRTIENMSKRDRERFEYLGGWIPPRVSDVEAIDQAVIIADRYQRSFLRLLQTLRDMRRVVNSVVMSGGQLNVAERQIVGTFPNDKGAD